MELDTRYMKTCTANLAGPSFSFVLYTGTPPVEGAPFTPSAYASQRLHAPITISFALVNGALAARSFPTTVATQTGQATWFGIFWNGSDVLSLIGSVGTQAAGTAPMQLIDTNLVSGANINFAQLTFKFA